jgi:hypothetical protein
MLPRYLSPTAGPKSSDSTLLTPATTIWIGLRSSRARSGSRPIAGWIVHNLGTEVFMEETDAGEAVDQVIEVEVVEERNADAYGFTVKVLANGLLHRILPLRDPDQPRFWCVVVFRCSPGGIPDPSEQPWVGLAGLRREELKETMSAIRADPSSWLAKTAHGQLRDWMLAPGPAPALTARRTVAAAATTHSDAQ